MGPLRSPVKNQCEEAHELNSRRAPHNRNVGRSELGEIIRDNSRYLDEQLHKWKQHAADGPSREPVGTLRELIGSQTEWADQAREKRVPYETRLEWLGMYPETLRWMDLGFKALEEKPDRLKLRPTDLVESWGYLRVESQRGRSVSLETLFHLAYMASFFTEGCHTKQLAISRLSYGWKSNLPDAYVDAVLSFHGSPGITTSVEAPIELLNHLTAKRQLWIDGVVKFGEDFTRVSRNLIRAANEPA